MLKYIKKESGQSMVLVAIMLAVLLGFGALAVDVGAMTYQRSSMQNAADAAALAGATKVPTLDLTKPEDVNALRTYAIGYAESNFKHSGATYTITPNAVNQTFTIEISQVVPKFLSGIISTDETNMTVSATAQYGFRWNGDALPFVNLDDTIGINETVQLWEKTSIPGDFECIWKEDYKYYPATNTFKVNWGDGITITEGRKMNKADDVESVVEPAMANNNTVYFFSLAPDYVNTLTKDVLKNKYVIPLEKLILVEGYITSFNISNANEPVMKIKVKKTYDIYNGVLPDDYNNSYANAIAHLVD